MHVTDRAILKHKRNILHQRSREWREALRSARGDVNGMIDYLPMHTRHSLARACGLKRATQTFEIAVAELIEDGRLREVANYIIAGNTSLLFTYGEAYRDEEEFEVWTP